MTRLSDERYRELLEKERAGSISFEEEADLVDEQKFRGEGLGSVAWRRAQRTYVAGERLERGDVIRIADDGKAYRAGDDDDGEDAK